MEPWEKVLEFHDVIQRHLRFRADWRLFIYHRGLDTVSDLPENVVLIECPNVGREIYPVFQHMISFYSNLPDIVVFVPGHWWSPQRLDYLGYIFAYMHQGYMPVPGFCDWQREKEFQIDEWGGSAVNKEGVSKQTFTHAKIRPFGKWFDARVASIGVPWKNYVTLCSTFACHRDKILRYSLHQLKDWLQEIEDGGANGEIGHYWERSFYSVFS